MTLNNSIWLRDLLSHRRIGVVSDLDGTLSPIAPAPGDATLTPRTLALLAALHEKIALVAVVSGRGVVDLRQRVGLPQLTYVGNHGLEWWEDGKVSVQPEALAYRPALAAALAELHPRAVPGMLIEDKDVTASVHYRQAADPEAIRREFLPIIEELAERYGLRLFEGRRIFELRPPIELDKGTAFRRLVETHALDAAVFLGDDVTDVDGMRVAREMRATGQCYALGIGVDSPGTPDSVRETGDVIVRGVPGVEDFLEWLLAAVDNRVA